MTDQTNAPEQPRPERSLKWLGPAILAAAIITPIVILIVSNADPASISWARWEWEAPGWIVLLATFVAGMLFAPVVGWSWRRSRRRRRAEAHERDIVRKHTSE